MTKLMSMAGFQKRLGDLLSVAGITVNGDQPEDIQVKDDRFYQRIFAEGSVGLGESYMDGWWDCERLDTFFSKALLARLDEKVKRSPKLLWSALTAKVKNRQSKAKASYVAEFHYDLGNDLYERMLDRRMLYTCAYWEGVDTLEEAQEKKLHLVCKKIGLMPGMRILDLGCGWGSFAKFAAEEYGAHVVGVNLSKEQLSWAREKCRGLPVEFRLQDYRDAQGEFDRVISIGIMEHVGSKNHKAYMDVVDRCLVPDGIAFIHTIGNNKPHVEIDPWYHKYIFPNALIPALSQLLHATEDRFVIEDLHNMGPHYDRTLMEWNHRFQKNWPELKKNYPERFKRMWEYYLLSSAGAFRARALQLWQIVLTRVGTPQPPCRIT